MKKSPAIFIAILLFFWIAFFSLSAQAAIDSAGVLDSVTLRYQAATSTWASIISARASWLFWVLATISMVWTFGMMSLRKSDIGEFFAEFIRFTVTTGFFWWLLSNGPVMATGIMDSLRTIAGYATGNGFLLTPSGIVDIGFNIFFKVLDQSSVWSPVDSLCGMALGSVILVILALIGVNMLILLISGWILAYAGIFILGFGGAKWTSDMAIDYFKTVLSLALQLMTMVLLVGIGKSFVDQYYTAMSAGINLKELGVMVVVVVTLLHLVNRIPPMIGALGGGNIHALGNGFGAGAALGAAAMGAAAVATAGAALAAGASSMAGGAQALMAAFSNANASENGGGSFGTGDLMAAAGSSTSGSDSGSSLASAMGDSGGSSPPLMGGMSSSSTDGASAGSDAKSEGDKGSAPGEVKTGGSFAAAASMAAKAGRVAAGTAANLAQGSWDVAKSKASSMKDSAMDRISETTGGKIAAAINARADAESGSKAEASGASATFDNNSLSAGAEKSADAESEVAAFRDRESKTS